jgi:hypothetical protein
MCLLQSTIIVQCLSSFRTHGIVPWTIASHSRCTWPWLYVLSYRLMSSYHGLVQSTLIVPDHGCMCYHTDSCRRTFDLLSSYNASDRKSLSLYRIMAVCAYCNLLSLYNASHRSGLMSSYHGLLQATLVVPDHGCMIVIVPELSCTIDLFIGNLSFTRTRKSLHPTRTNRKVAVNLSRS